MVPSEPGFTLTLARHWITTKKDRVNHKEASQALIRDH